MRKIGGWLIGKIIFRKTVLELESLKLNAILKRHKALKEEKVS